MAHTELIAALDHALSALKDTRKSLLANAKLQVRSKATTNKQAAPRKGMSEEGRQRIAEAQRKRWAASKKAAKKAARLAVR